MIVALPVDENNENTTLCMSYGRCPFYMLYDTETKKISFLENKAVNDQGGAGIKASQVLADHKIGAVLTQRCGENAAKVLNEASIKIYKTTEIPAKDNIKAFEEGKLQALSNIHPGFHGHSGN